MALPGITNGSFLQGTGFLSDTPQFSNWTQNGVGYSAAGKSGDAAATFGNPSQNPGTLKQTISGVTPNAQYLLSGWVEAVSFSQQYATPNFYQTPTPNGLSVSFGGGSPFALVTNDVTTTAFTPFSQVVTASSVGTSDVLQFTGYDPPGVLLLSDVSLTPYYPGAPEVDPGSGLVPTALAAGGLLLLESRRRKKA